MSHPAKNPAPRRNAATPAGSPKPRVVVDAAGGDTPLGARVRGAIDAARLYSDTRVILCADESKLEPELEKLGGAPANLSIRHAAEEVGMHESPVQAVRTKKESSIAVGVGLVAAGEADAFVSAGNTGAVAAASTLMLGRLKGVSRPGIAAAMQIIDHPAVAIDVGANVDSKPVNLLQWAIMATVFAKHIMGVENPRVGLLNVGTEPGKGCELTRKAYGLLSEADLNFLGNVEPEQLFYGQCDIVVCDGFTGNILLKMGESLIMRLVAWLKDNVRGNLRYTLGFALCKKLFKHLKYCADFAEYGGAPLLGVNGVTIITHGASDARAIQNAVREARSFVLDEVNAHIEEAIQTDSAARLVRS